MLAAICAGLVLATVGVACGTGRAAASERAEEDEQRRRHKERWEKRDARRYTGY